MASKKKKQNTAKQPKPGHEPGAGIAQAKANQGKKPPGAGQLNLASEVQQWIPNLPPDLANQVGQMISNGADENRVFAFVHGTPWFQQNYAGFDAGVGKALWGGTIQDLSAYRQWRASVNQTMQQYYGREANQGDYISYATQGFGAGQIQNIGQGHAWAQANMGDVNYAVGAFDSGQPLTPQQIQTLGEQESGNTSTMGALLETRFKTALAKMNDLFGSTLAQNAQQKLPPQQNPNRQDVGA